MWAAGGVNACYFMPAPFRFCLQCGVAYSGRQTRTSASSPRWLARAEHGDHDPLPLGRPRICARIETLARAARKLLSFTDNRQDASLQAGHFNDFVEIGLLARRLYRAVEAAGAEGFGPRRADAEGVRRARLPLDDYASDPDVQFQAAHRHEQGAPRCPGLPPLPRPAARLAHDVAQPGAVRPAGDRATSRWTSCATPRMSGRSAIRRWPALRPRTAGAIAKVLLDYMRRELAIKVDYLDETSRKRIEQRSSQRLRPWAIDENEMLEHAAVALPALGGCGTTTAGTSTSRRAAVSASTCGGAPHLASQPSPG